MMNIFHNIFLALVPFNAPMELVGFHLGGPSRKITHNIETGTTVRNVGTKKCPAWGKDECSIFLNILPICCCAVTSETMTSLWHCAASPSICNWMSLCSRTSDDYYLKHFRLFLQFNDNFSRWTWVSQYQNMSILDLLELRMMEVVVTTRAICAQLQSNRHHQQTNTQFFYRPDALSVTQPTMSKHWREGLKHFTTKLFNTFVCRIS